MRRAAGACGSARSAGRARTVVLFVVVVLVLLFALVVGLVARYLFYWGPSDEGRDFAQELYDLSLEATGREELGNAEDWARFTLVGQAYDDALAAHEASGAYPSEAAEFAVGLLDPESSEWVVGEDEEDEEWDESLDGPRDEEEEVPPPEVRLAASRAMVEAFRAQGGFDRLEELARAVEARGVPVREVYGLSMWDDPMIDLRQSRSVAQLLLFEARSRANQDESEYAAAILLAIHRIGHVYMVQNQIVERLVGIAINTLAIDELRLLSQDPSVSAKTIQSLRQCLRAPSRDIESVLRGDSLWIRSTSVAIWGGGNLFIPNSAEAQGNQLNHAIDLIEAAEETDRASLTELKAFSVSLEQDFRYHRSSGLVSAYADMMQTDYRHAMQLRYTLLVLSIELYRRAEGALPTTLNALDAFDPEINSNDFVYKRIEVYPGYELTHADILPYQR